MTLAGLSDTQGAGLPEAMFPGIMKTGMEPDGAPAPETDEDQYVLKEVVARTYNLLNPENLLQYQLDLENILLHQQSGLIRVLHRTVNTDTTRDPPRTVVHMEWAEFKKVTGKAL